MTDIDMDEKGAQLEQALKAAVADPDARPAFYQQLMDAQVYVVGRIEPGHENEKPDDGKPHYQLKQWQQEDGSLAMPFFATMDSFRDMFGDSEPHIVVSVIDLFQFSGNGSTLVMTCPEGSKDFKPDEVEMLLNLALGDPLVMALERAMKNTDKELVMPLWNEFYSTLVNSRIFLLGKPADAATDGEGNVRRQLKEGENLSIASWTHPSVEGPIVPFFSSQRIMNKTIPAGESYMSLSAVDFLNMATAFDRPLVLNPGYEFNKVFTAQEVKDILAATSRQPDVRPRAMEDGATYIFGNPANPPQEVISALKDFLPGWPQVKGAYLATKRQDKENAPTSFVVGFEGEDGTELVPMFEAAGPLVRENAKEGMIIDFTRLKRGEEGLSQYMFERVEPFYTRPGQENQGNGQTEISGEGPADQAASEAEDFSSAGRPESPADALQSEDSEKGGQTKSGFMSRLKRMFGAG